MSYSEQTKLSTKQRELLSHIYKSVDDYSIELSLEDVTAYAADIGQKTPYWLVGTQRWDKDGMFKTGKGKDATFRLPFHLLDAPVPTKQLQKVAQRVAKQSPVSQEVITPVEDVKEVVTPEPKEVKEVSFIPLVDKSYVKFGHHKDIETIIKSEMFYPAFVTGLSGNGKTFMIEQICAKLKRECIRVNITIETDEDDLLGGFRLVDGETVFHKGPVVDAMERGAVLLLDEVDLASNKILALQPVLEGKGVFLKKINEWVTPQKGFTVVATANTKGKGSDTGAFVGTQILNEAFLERFAVTFEQDYASNAVEKRIVVGAMETAGHVDEDFALHLVKWADIIRKTYHDGGVDEILATRRLVHIATSFGIFKDREKAIDLCIARFDDETKESFKDLYEKIDETVGDVVDTPTDELDKTPF
tara:strand:+ start:74 stop:1324 length:1251 start_codon:yes stop_codon:yes gene_type:complete